MLLLGLNARGEILMEYLITPAEETDWKISRDYFVNNLLKEWSDIHIQEIRNPDNYYQMEWFTKVSGESLRLDGALHRDGQGISLDGYLKDCAKFAIWFRSLVPKSQKLIFYDQGYNYYIELQEGTTESEILAAFESTNLERVGGGK